MSPRNRSRGIPSRQSGILAFDELLISSFQLNWDTDFSSPADAPGWENSASTRSKRSSVHVEVLESLDRGICHEVSGTGLWLIMWCPTTTSDRMTHTCAAGGS